MNVVKTPPQSKKWMSPASTQNIIEPDNDKVSQPIQNLTKTGKINKNIDKKTDIPAGRHNILDPFTESCLSKIP